MRGRRGRPDFRGRPQGHHRGRMGNNQHMRNNTHGARRFSGDAGHQNFRPFSNGPDVPPPGFEHGPPGIDDGMIQERLIDKEPLVVTVGPVDDGILTEEDGEIREDPPSDALLPTPVPRPVLLQSPPAINMKGPPGPPPGPPPEGAKPFVPIGLTSQGHRMLQRSSLSKRPPPQREPLLELPSQHQEVDEVAQSEFEMERIPIEQPRKVEYRAPQEQQLTQRPDSGIKAKDENGVPLFLLCPLCKDLLLKPLVLPCFHAICGERCVPRLIEDGFNIWCPTCRQLKATKCGVNFLKQAETFGKMSRQIREEKLAEAIEKGEVPEHCTIEEIEDKDFHKSCEVDDLTCQECHKLFSLPLRLPCSHCICKFPCAYKMLKHNVKIVCSICEKPNYCNDGVKALPVDESLVESLKLIKGDSFVEQFELKLRDIAEGKDLQLKRADGQPLNEEELNKYRFQKVSIAEQRSKAVPSLLSLDTGLPPPPPPPPQPPQGKRPLLSKPNNWERPAGPPVTMGQDFKRPHHIPNQPPRPYSEDHVSEELRKIRNDQDNEPYFPSQQKHRVNTTDNFEFEAENWEENSEFEKNNEAEDDYVVEELPPEFAEMANAWAGPKRCRPAKKVDIPRRQTNHMPEYNEDNRAERYQKYEKSRDRNKTIDDTTPPGVEIFEYNNHSRPQPSKAPSLLDLDVQPTKKLLGSSRKREGMLPLEVMYPELEDEILLRSLYRRMRPPYRDHLDPLDLDPFFDRHMDALPPLSMLPPAALPPLGPDGLPLGPPPPVTAGGLQPPPDDTVDVSQSENTEVRPAAPGLNITMTPATQSIPSMIYGTGSGPPPIVNYGSAPATDTVPTQSVAPMQQAPALPEPGQLQAAPATLPVMDPSTIPTMSSAFEYQAHWTKFVQQTQAYYNNLYAAQGGTPAEAQQTINDYLAKCWAWYSAYTNLCLVNPEYKDMGKEPVKEKQPKADTSVGGAEDQSGKNKAKKKKKNKAAKAKQSEAASKETEGIEEKELEELKIMLLKKQLELKVKHARNKSELRGLMNMKKLILEEEGEEKVEEIDEEEREKVKEAAKQKQLERAQEIERQERERAKDREKEIQRLEQERIREREKERQREKEMRKREMEEKARKEKQREREYDKPRSRRSDDSYRKKKRKRYSRSKSRSYSRSHSRSYSRSRSRSRSPANNYRKRPVKEVQKEEIKDEEPKYIKVANLPDDLKAVELKSFVEAFGRVLNCKIGKMQGDMMAVVQMACLADAMSCVRDMHGAQFKSKILEVKYMGNKPNLKSVEVSIPDVHAGPSSSGSNPKAMHQYKPMPGPSYGYGPDYYNKPAEIRHIWIGNLPWGTTEDEIMRLVYHHGTPLDCRLATSNDPSKRGLYAVVTMESYIDVLKCINSLHGVRFEGKTLDVKKMKY